MSSCTASESDSFFLRWPFCEVILTLQPCNYKLHLNSSCIKNNSLQNHRITKVGNDLQDHPVQLFTYPQYFLTKPCLLVQHLNVSWTPPGMVTPPPPWAAHSSTWPLFQSFFFLVSNLNLPSTIWGHSLFLLLVTWEKRPTATSPQPPFQQL